VEFCKICMFCKIKILLFRDVKRLIASKIKVCVYVIYVCGVCIITFLEDMRLLVFTFLTLL